MRGEIQLILGPMFAGKTSELLRRLRRYQLGKKRVIAIKSAKDARYAKDVICTHAKEQWTEVLVTDELGNVNVCDCDVVGIDEGQFFRDLDVVCEAWAQQGKVVIVAMLDSTFERTPFPDGCLARLLAQCESVTKLTAVCPCGADAAFTCKVTSETVDKNGELVGGAERYRAACRGCHK